MLKLTSFSPNVATPRLNSSVTKSALGPAHTAIANPNKSASTAPTETVSFSSTGSFAPLNSNSGQAAIVTQAKAAPSEPLKSQGSGPILLEAAEHSIEHNPKIDGFLGLFLEQVVKAAKQMKQQQSQQIPDSGRKIKGIIKDNGTFSNVGMNFSESAKVVSNAQKFVIPVPTFAATGGGEDLVYPAGATNKEGQSIAGQPIADWEGKPIGGPGEKGVVFFNRKDQSYQAVKADGNGVVIFNQVTNEQGKKLQDKIGKDPSELSLQEFKGALEYASRPTLLDDHGAVIQDGLDAADLYNSDRDFIKSKMNAMEASETGVPQYGLYRRDDRDVCEVLCVDGQGEFQGPAATPQKFEDGAVILRQTDAKADDGFIYRLIQPDLFFATYTNKDGSAIDLDSLPRHEG